MESQKLIVFQEFFWRKFVKFSQQCFLGSVEETDGAWILGLPERGGPASVIGHVIMCQDCTNDEPVKTWWACSSLAKVPTSLILIFFSIALRCHILVAWGVVLTF